MMASKSEGLTEQQQHQQLVEQLLLEQQQLLKRQQEQQQQLLQEQQHQQQQLQLQHQEQHQWQQQQWQQQEQQLQQQKRLLQQLIQQAEAIKQIISDQKQQVTWEEKLPIPVACYGHSAVQLGELVYVGSGYVVDPESNSRKSSYEIHVYNTLTNSWNSPIHIDYCWFSMATLNNTLLIVGGKGKNGKAIATSDQIFKMDPTGHLEFYTRMNTPRSWTTAISHKEMLLIVGGKDVNGKALSSVELFDSNNEEWYICSNLPLPHYLINAVIVNNSLYLLGGVNQNNKCSPKVFVASLDTLLAEHELNWNAHNDTPYLCSAPVSVDGTHLLLLGGSKDQHHEYTSDVYRLDQGSESWVKIDHLPFARNLLAPVVMHDGSIIVIGGTKNKGIPINTVWKGSYSHPQ